MKRIIWIEVKETVTRNIGLEIGDEMTEDKAKELIDKTKETEECDWDNPIYSKLQCLLGNDSISDTNGYHDIQVYIEER